LDFSGVIQGRSQCSVNQWVGLSFEDSINSLLFFRLVLLLFTFKWFLNNQRTSSSVQLLFQEMLSILGHFHR
jgi:hypothetical protein